MIKNETCLNSYLNCMERVNFVELYENYQSLTIIFEDMNVSLDSVIKAQNMHYCEEFCRYTIYKVALGLQMMHSKDLIHRDVRSGNVFCNKYGDIKLNDLGLSVPLS